MELKARLLSILNVIFDFCKKHTESMTIIGLGLVFYFIFFHNIGTYSLMDVDETRYVSMARDMFHSKDFMTLYLNGEYFFEKPPLYFWQECLSFLFFGKVNEFTARFPVALLGFILSFVVYFVSKKNISRGFGVITSLILATSLEFVILSKYAILDIVLAFYVGLSLISYFQIFFCKESNKKYFWWAFYIFSGLAVIAKGIPGIVIPFGTVFFTSIITKRFKEIFKPINIIPGIILFLTVTLPWHIIMFKKYDPLFFNEYIVKHHLHRFLNTENNEIGRKQPIYYYLLVLTWGLFPWIFSIIATIIEKFKNLSKVNIELIKSFNFSNLDNMQKYLILNGIAAIWILCFFSSSSTKLATYILPIYCPLSIIIGYIWKKYMYEGVCEKSINLSVKIIGWLFLIAGVVALFVPLFLPAQLVSDIADVRWLTLISLIVFGVCSLLFVKSKKYTNIFVLYVLFMVIISAFSTGKFFEVDYKFGQDNLIEFAKYAKNNNLSITAYEMNRKYSLNYYSESIVDYNPELSVENVEKDLKKPNNILIIKNKQMDMIENNLDYDVVKVGRRYTMIKGK